MAILKKTNFALAPLLTWSILLAVFVPEIISQPAFSAPQPSPTAQAPSSRIPATQISVAQTLPAPENEALDAKNKHIIATTLETNFKANSNQIWQALIDFTKYPTFFTRINSVAVTKREGNFVYTETGLKPHMFVKCPVQHCVNDLSAGPNLLSWRMLDGNFKYLKGKWELTQKSPGLCSVKYTIYVDVGPIIPPPLVNFVVHRIQQEIVDQLKQHVEVSVTADLKNSQT